MLIRQTLLYMPAQLLPAAAQFASLAIWSHYTTSRVIGIVALFVSIQDLLVLGLISFWSSYTLRFLSKQPEHETERLSIARTSTFVVMISTLSQTLISIILYVVLIDPSPRAALLPVLAIVAATRALNAFQGERARSQGDILLYSVQVGSGPIIGMALGIAMLVRFGSDEFWIFLGFAIAQFTATVIGFVRESSWIRFGRPDRRLIRHAFGYGMPLIVGAMLAWITQNSARLTTGYFYGLAAAGVYSLGFGLGFRATVVAAMAVTAPAFPLAVRYANAGDHAGAMRQLAHNATLLLAVLAAATAGLAVIARDMLTLFIAAPLREACLPVLLWAAVAGFAVCFRQHFLNQIFLLKASTRPVAIVAAVEASISVVAALAIVPWYGSVGGAISLAISSLASMATMMVLGARAGFAAPWREFAKVALATGVMTAATWATPQATNLIGFIFRIMVGAMSFAMAMAVIYLPFLKHRYGVWRFRNGRAVS